MVLDLNFGSSIPQEVVQNMQKTILDFQQRYKDGYIGRQLIEQRPGVPPKIRKDVVRHVDKTTPQDGISHARISLGGTSPDIVGSKGKDKLFQIYRIDDAIQRNEDEIALDPALWTRDTSISMMECLRRENYTIINGDATWGITGLVGAASANSLGSIVASGGDGSTTIDNNGAWAGTETDKVMDPYDDIRAALNFIDPDLIGSLLLAGRPAYMNYLLQEDDLGKIYADKIGPRIFGKAAGDNSWMVKSDYFPANYVYLVLKSMEAAELVIPEDYNVDANYPRQKGQNVYAEIGGWIGIELHTNDFIVPIAIN
jgi:hypothetical protein